MITRDSTTRSSAQDNTILLTDFKTHRWALTVALMTGLLAACESDRPVTGPDGAAAPSAPAVAADSAEVKTRRELEATAAPHWADGYVWAYSPTSASYTASGFYAFNRSGGAIQITRQGVGQYTVRFSGLSALLGAKSTVKVTGYNSNNDYCKPISARLVSDVVGIRCFNANTGAAVDAYYTVLVMRNYVELAFAHAQLPTSTNYAPQANASWNPAGPIRIFRNGTGSYTVRFSGLGSRLASNGGHAQVVHVGTGAGHCKIGSWGGSPDLDVSVVCFSRSGALVDTKFNLLFLLPNSHLGYTWASDPAALSYFPNSYYSSNSGGGQIQITRSGTGQYHVTWNGLSGDLLDGGDVQVSAYGGFNPTAQCKVEFWGSQDAYVRCFSPNGTLVDSQFDVLYGS
jgi:hypothetical protein